MTDTSPIRFSFKTSKITELMDKQIHTAPHVNTIYLNNDAYETLLGTIPYNLRNRYVHKMMYRGYSVFKAPR